VLNSRIDYWIGLRGYKKMWVAKQMKVSREVLSRWINNHTKPSLENAFKLAKLLDCKVDDLYFWDCD